MVTSTTDPNNIYGPYNEKLRVHYDELKQIADNIDSLTQLSVDKDALVEVNNSKDSILELNTYSDLRDNLPTILSMPTEFAQTTQNVNNTLDQANTAISIANSANTATNESVLLVTQKANEAKDLVNDVKTDFDTLFISEGNLINKATIRENKQLSLGNTSIIDSSFNRVTDFITLKKDTDYTIFGGDSIYGAFFNSKEDTDFSSQISTSGGSVKTFNTGSGEGNVLAVFNITNDSGTDTTYDDTVCLKEGIIASPTYSPYKQVINEEKLPKEYLTEEVANTKYTTIEEFEKFFEEKPKKNLANPELINYSFRHYIGIEGNSSQQPRIIASASHEVGTGYIPVVEGKFYAISDLSGVSNPFEGGYYENNNETLNNLAVQNIELLDPPSGSGVLGKIFLVPTGLNINYIQYNLNRGTGDTINGFYQLEEGEIPTEYEEYILQKSFTDLVIENLNIPSSNINLFNSSDYLKYSGPTRPDSLLHKLPNHQRDMNRRDKDVTEVMTGTSIMGRTVTYCSPHPNAANRPPLLHSMNSASIYFDSKVWEGQKYSRYDSNEITETGTEWLTSFNEPEWDDGLYRNGLTRYTDTVGSLSYPVAKGDFSVRFIYCPDSQGGTSTISISSGNNKIQLKDPSDGVWKEANGFVLNTLESSPVSRNVIIPDPTKENDAVNKNITLNVSTKSNRTYQKRLKMRCKWTGVDSRNEDKTITITRNTGRLAYWGFESSPREFMYTFINASRGSHLWNCLDVNGRALPLFADNEVWDFEPTLILAEHSHNDGTAGGGVSSVVKWDNLINEYAFGSNELSLVSRATALNLDVPEIAIFGTVIGKNSKAFDDDDSDGDGVTDEWEFGSQGSNYMFTALDKFRSGYQWMIENKPDSPYANMSQYWIDSAKTIFNSNLQIALEGSGITGNTLLADGTHMNDTGAAIFAAGLVAYFGKV